MYQHPYSSASLSPFTLFAQGLPLLVVNHCLKPSPLPRRMGHAFMSEQVRPVAFIAYKFKMSHINVPAIGPCSFSLLWP
jgi:hypothetical protein